MSKRLVVIVGSLFVLATASNVLAKHNHPKTRDIITFQTMYGVDGPFIGETNAIRGVEGDEAPWTIKHNVRGKLDTKGHLKIHVHGLVFTDDEIVPPEKRGTNDEPTFRGLVSCLTEEGDSVVTKNVPTAEFPATIPSGDSDIDATIDLPNPCVAPIIFILAGSEDKWFAVTGFERPEEDQTPAIRR